MNNRRGAMWAALALLGIVLAAGLTLSVMRLAGEHIGLASAPISVVRGLAPAPGTGSGAVPPEHDVTVTRTVTVSRTVTETGSGSGAATTAATGATTGTAGTTAPSQVTRVAPQPATTSSAVTISPPSGKSPKGSEDGRQDSRQSSSGRDD